MQLFTLAGFIFSLAALTPALARVGPCTEEVQRLGPEMPGKFVPKCTETGFYNVEQCHGSTGYCWCVDFNTGKELQGSRVAPGHGRPACAQPLSLLVTEPTGPCVQERQRLGTGMMLGKFIPKCTENGFYQVEQCHGSTGYCWCVDPKTGKEIQGSRVAPGHGRPVCAQPLALLVTGPCAQEQQRLGTEMPGKFVPQCTESGYYRVEQCHGSTGYCWCVDPNTGKELQGSRVAPGHGQPACAQQLSLLATAVEPTGPCAQERQRLGTGVMFGKFIPECTGNGYYQIEQCHGSTGYCWCVDPNTGKEVQGTRIAPGHGRPVCVNQMSLLVTEGPCAQERQRIGTVMMPGKYVPQCTEDGFYRAEQCHGSTGYCWCVDPKTGKELQGSRVAPGHGQPACAQPLSLLAIERKGPCAQERERLGTEMPGKFVPQCTEAGYYKVQQYYGSTGYSWCVDPDTGKELEGSRVAPGKGQLECPPCFKYNEDKLGGKCTLSYLAWTPMCRLGAPKQPMDCDYKTGNFQPLQKSHDSYRWCVNPLTGAMEGEKRHIDDKTPLPCEH